ncbi:versicolorin reductase [Colletotrichum asianum]
MASLTLTKFYRIRFKRHTVDPLAVGVAQRGDDLANVGGDTDTLEGVHVGQALVDDLDGHALVAVGDVVPRVLVVHVGLDTTGGDGVDSDALGAAVDGEGAGEALDGGLGAGVQGVVGDAAHDGGDGGGQEDAAAAPAVLQALLGDEELAAGVEVEDVLVELLGDVLLGAPDLLARVGDDEVHAAEVGDGAVEEVDDLLGLGDVCLEGDGLGAHLLDLGDDLLGGAGGGAVVDDDVGAALAELEGDAASDTAAGAGDQGDLADEGAGGVGGAGLLGGGVEVGGGSHFVCKKQQTVWFSL